MKASPRLTLVVDSGAQRDQVLIARFEAPAELERRVARAHEIEGRGSTDDEPRQGRLQRERQSYREKNSGGSHSGVTGGVSTIRTASSEA